MESREYKLTNEQMSTLTLEVGHLRESVDRLSKVLMDVLDIKPTVSSDDYPQAP